MKCQTDWYGFSVYTRHWAWTCQWDENDVSASQADGELFGNAEHEQPSCGSEEEVSDSDVSIESTNAEDDECDGGIELTSINNVADFANVEWNKLNEESFLKHDFANRDLAFRFYNWYARVKGFSARKDRIGKRGEVIVRSTFVCYRMGEHKSLVKDTHRWHVKELFDEHNHELLDERFQGMLTRHRRMDVSELMQMNDIREAGIGTPSIYQALANQCGGFDRVGFRVRDMYNEIVKQRKSGLGKCTRKEKCGATAYLRGTFFVGYTTTSRCEGLHSQLKKFVHYRNNLTEFCHHLTRCAKYMRQKEVEADFDSSTGEQLIHTGYLHLERSASLVYTHMKELPKSLIVDRWTKKAKEHFWKSNGVSPQYMQSLFRAWYLAMLKSCEEMCEVGCLTQFGFYDTMEKIATQKQFLKARNQAAAVNDDNVEDRNMSVVKDPIRVRGKGCSDMLRCDGGVRKRRPRCSSCRREGHNKTTCPLRNSLGNIAGGSQTRPVASVELGSREWNQTEARALNGQEITWEDDFLD
ncbi:hypothetical protein SESBI_50729 [Sesbania bispinosa]|nr:hypothetical protein SESBI_50729 [Sesbania bispinosa]